MSDTHRLLTREHLVTNTNENDLTGDDEITEPVPDVSAHSGQRLHRAQGPGHQNQEGLQVREKDVRGEDTGDCPGGGSEHLRGDETAGAGREEGG